MDGQFVLTKTGAGAPFPNKLWQALLVGNSWFLFIHELFHDKDNRKSSS